MVLYLCSKDLSYIVTRTFYLINGHNNINCKNNTKAKQILLVTIANVGQVNIFKFLC